MEKRNIIEAGRTPNIKQASEDTFDKEAVGVFKAAPTPYEKAEPAVTPVPELEVPWVAGVPYIED